MWEVCFIGRPNILVVFVSPGDLESGLLEFFVNDEIVATVTVSGLPQQDDHELALKHLESLRS